MGEYPQKSGTGPIWRYTVKCKLKTFKNLERKRKSWNFLERKRSEAPWKFSERSESALRFFALSEIFMRANFGRRNLRSKFVALLKLYFLFCFNFNVENAPTTIAEIIVAYFEKKSWAELWKKFSWAERAELQLTSAFSEGYTAQLRRISIRNSESRNDPPLFLCFLKRARDSDPESTKKTEKFCTDDVTVGAWSSKSTIS